MTWAVTVTENPTTVTVSSDAVVVSVANTDNTFAIVDEADPTKKLMFSVGGQATGSTLTITLPALAASRTLNLPLITGTDTIAALGLAQTWSATQSFAAISASGQITSTVSTGTAPFVVASTTAVANLNASFLLGSTWAAPAAIGTGTPSSGAFTTLTASGDSTFTTTTDATSSTAGGVAFSGGIAVAKSIRTGGVVEAIIDNATTNGTNNCIILSHTTTGTAAAGIGARLLYQLEDDGGTKQVAGYVDVRFTDVTSASRTSAMVFGAVSAATSADLMRLTGTGNLLIGGTTDISGSGGLKVFGTTASSSSTTGALIVAGGLGVSTAINAGGNIGGGRFLSSSSSTSYQASGSACIYRSGGTITPSTGDMVFQSDVVGSRGFYFAGGSSTATMFRVTGAGNVVLGAASAALATNATDGFLYLPTCAGTPTGAPTAFTGNCAFVYDTTNNKLYVYNGAWKATAALT